MTDVKPAIERLCKLLSKLGLTKITAEVVRKAKYDQENSVKAFWKLLAEVFILKEVNWNVSNERWLSFVTKLDVDVNIVDYVKENFLELSYTRLAFYNLPSAQTFGSRELLIAFAWLLTHVNPIQRLLDNSLEHGHVNGRYLQHLQTVPPNLNFNPNTVSSAKACREFDSDHARLEYLIWLLGKLRFTSRRLLQRRYEELHLLAKFHSMCTESISIQGCSLTTLHFQLLLKQEFLEQYLQILHQETSVLKLYCKWKAVEDNFWKWMVSVVDLAEQNTDTSVNKGSLLLSIYRAACLKQLGKIEAKHNTMQTNVLEMKIYPYQESKPELELLSNICNKLQEKKEELVSDLSERQEICRTMLHTLSERIPGITCVKPLSRCATTSPLL